ncbi:DegT/DnrJ/EryC1/StrS family aminotransferase [Candidatus Saganbacteria bacterium]|nr:DegT/DnrJ/EryC1/StrS family aminotransferase [Candidatus Saganbacteria bacterium]
MSKIPVYKPFIDEQERKNVLDCLDTGWISSLGKYIPMFEQQFADYCGKKYGVATSNGTNALHMALKSLAIGVGDEVVVPALSFIATTNAVLYTNAKPIFVDSEMETWNIDPSLIENKITKRTKAIIAVHLYGQPVRIKLIKSIAKKHGLFLIEDAAEAHGAECNGKKVGSYGDISCFSFYGNKVITTGEGGMCLTNDRKVYEKLRMLRDHGMSKTVRYWHPEMGYNYRMTNIQAAIGLAQLKKIDMFIQNKRQIATWYDRELADVPGIVLPPRTKWAKSVYWLYSILITPECRIGRDGLMKKLHDCGVDTRPLFIPNHRMPYIIMKNHDRFYVAETLSKTGINLPSYPMLTEKEVKYVAACIKKYCR